MKSYRTTPIKDKDGRIDIDKVEMYNVDDPEERLPVAFNNFRIGEYISERDFIIHEGIVYNKKLLF